MGTVGDVRLSLTLPPAASRSLLLEVGPGRAAPAHWRRSSFETGPTRVFLGNSDSRVQPCGGPNPCCAATGLGGPLTPQAASAHAFSLRPWPFSPAGSLGPLNGLSEIWLSSFLCGGLVSEKRLSGLVSIPVLMLRGPQPNLGHQVTTAGGALPLLKIFLPPASAGRFFTTSATWEAHC